MEIVKMESGQPPKGTVESVRRVIDDGGVACLPCNGTYRLFADVLNEGAVMRLFQSKRRVHKAPCLVFVASIEALERIADSIDPVARKIMDELWPAPLTIRFDASREIPRKVAKELTKATGKIGVRIPQNSLSRRVVETFGGPVLVSSANRGQKSGETSPAQVRQNFLGRIDYFVDAGDLSRVPGSTVIDVDKSAIEVVRAGAVSRETIDEIVA